MLLKTIAPSALDQFSVRSAANSPHSDLHVDKYDDLCINRQIAFLGSIKSSGPNQERKHFHSINAWSRDKSLNIVILQIARKAGG